MDHATQILPAYETIHKVFLSPQNTYLCITEMYRLYVFRTTTTIWDCIYTLDLSSSSHMIADVAFSDDDTRIGLITMDGYFYVLEMNTFMYTQISQEPAHVQIALTLLKETSAATAFHRAHALYRVEQSVV